MIRNFWPDHDKQQQHCMTEMGQKQSSLMKLGLYSIW